ncbi:signal peptide peptidase SppA [Alkalihalophilus marmarensis]|uniref:Signal peptide protein n=1 Tax=Alkalihalophilus marmarensis DSM 21297 TaxID=1188261 RepID=U6SP66_9BACI|nr:signal peptide peptidase SppA [Alkalihalophilus marmarensis]ERN52426.1 signal peptide protein [Alkalihalophilus marmarensis DSM 21297]
MSRKRWLALIAALMLVVAAVGVNVATSQAGADLDRMFGSEHGWAERVIEQGDDFGNSIVVLELNGVIQDTGDAVSIFDAQGYRHQAFLSQIEHAAKDSSVQGLIIRVNTPGGGVVESAEIHEKIVEVQEEYNKPVYISMGSMAASGGYYIAAPADKIVASPQTITGSLGVIMESINIAELAENYGIKFNTIKSGEYKDIMSATREMTEGDRAILQSLIDESYDEFVRIISEGRNMSENEVRQLADGRIYTGNQALEIDLVDELGSLDDTIAMMREDLGANYSVIKYEADTGLYSLFSMTAAKMLSSNNELASIEQLITERRAPTLKYLYTE